MKSLQAQRDLCLCSSAEPEDMTCDCIPSERMDLLRHHQPKKKRIQQSLFYVLCMYRHVESADRVEMWTLHSLHIVWYCLWFCPSYPPHSHVHTSNPTTTTAVCTANFKELKGRFRKHVTHTCLLGNVHALHSDSSVTFPYVIRNSNQLRVSLSASNAYPISCCCHVVCRLSLKFLLTVR